VDTAAASAPQPPTHVQEMQADIVFQQDVFMMYDDKIEEMDATKPSVDFEPKIQKKIDDDIFDQDVDDFKNELN
jgi:hypothetical protein